MTHVLVLEDELSIRKTFQTFLEEQGYNVTVGDSLFRVESFLIEHSCDVVLVDIALSNTSGLNMLQQVRQIDENIPIILSAGESDVSLAADAMLHGAYDYVIKPITQQVLTHVVGRAVEKKRLLDDNRRLEVENQKNASLYQETNRRLTEARLIQEMMLAATSTLDFDLVLERTVKALHRALKIDRLGFLLPDEKKGVLELHPSLVGFTGNVFRIPIEGSFVGRAFQTGRPVLVQDTVQTPAYFDQTPDVRSALAAPVRVGGRIVAVLHAESPDKNAFGEDKLRLFATIAGQLGVALDNARLYQRLGAQAAELSQAYEELREINRLRTELVQNVGHELRTPLGLVKGYVELLLAGDLGDIPNNQRTALEVVRARAASLERLIHNLTVLQSVPREALTLASMSIDKVLGHVLAEYRLSAQKAGVVFRDEFTVDLPLVMGDRTRLHLVLSHLADNAVKFSPDGGTIAVCAWADQERVFVSIADEGIGIPFEHRKRIFERFYQVDGSASRRFGGMGVGLALVWEIIEAHDGTVDVESEPGKGSIFTIALPRADRID
ncbi:MAG: response regulator [Chloroflexi bacterium]|nr:response regulator [Chloroflexota bacterium]